MKRPSHFALLLLLGLLAVPAAVFAQTLDARLSGFDKQSVVGSQPISGPDIEREDYTRELWYKERAEALFTIEKKSFARSGKKVGVANATLNY
jgi:hypothetical protein